jgi:hypothetical protein
VAFFGSIQDENAPLRGQSSQLVGANDSNAQFLAADAKSEVHYFLWYCVSPLYKNLRIVGVTPKVTACGAA